MSKQHLILSKERNFTIESFDMLSFVVTKSNVASTLLPKTATMSKQHLILSKERNFTIESFDMLSFVVTKSNVASTLLLVWTGP